MQVFSKVELNHTRKTRDLWAVGYNVNFSVSCFSLLDNKYIWWTTIHQAKGLEFPVVFIIGLADGLFPLKSLNFRKMPDFGAKGTIYRYSGMAF